MIIEDATHEEDITIIKLYTTYNIADNYIKQKLLTMQGEFENVYILMAETFTVFQKVVDQIGFKN